MCLSSHACRLSRARARNGRRARRSPPAYAGQERSDSVTTVCRPATALHREPQLSIDEPRRFIADEHQFVVRPRRIIAELQQFVGQPRCSLVEPLLFVDEPPPWLVNESLWLGDQLLCLDDQQTWLDDQEQLTGERRLLIADELR